MWLLMYGMIWTKIFYWLGIFTWESDFYMYILASVWFKELCINYGRSGIQMRRNSWQDGVLGTNCPIPPKWNWTYQFQVKDQIGSFYYFPSLNFQRASGGFGPIVINNREIIPIPFPEPDGEISIMIGDWYTRNHKVSFCFICGVIELFQI